MKKEYLNVWNIVAEDFPFSKNVAEQIKFVLKYAVLAPSTHNIQPWLFRVESNTCSFLFDPQAVLPHGDSERRYATISIGAALENFIIAATAFGMKPSVQYMVNEDVYARVSVEAGKILDDKYIGILKSITERVNVRGVFQSGKISDEIVSLLRSEAEAKECTAHIYTDQEKISHIAELTALGLQRAHKQDTFRKEMATHIVSNISESPIGIPGYTMNLPLIFSLIIPKLIYYKDLSPILSKLNYKSIASAPIVCVITAKQWNRRSWLEVGQTAERLILHAQSRGMHSSVYVAATEFDETALELQKIIHTEERPAFIFCMGYMKKRYKHAQRVPSERKIIS